MQQTLAQVLNECAELSRSRERERVEAWRLEQLVAAGWPRGLAGLVALDLEIDLHEAVGLVRAGCDPLTAFEILL